MSEKRREAINTIRKHMALSAGAGLIPIPFADLAAVSGVQLNLLAEISKIYGVPYKENIGKAVVSSLSGYVFPHALAGGAFACLLKYIPVVGYLSGAPTMALLCGSWTWALGNVFIQHFESGGTFLNFDSEQVKKHFQARFEEGRKVTTAMEREEKAKSPANSGTQDTHSRQRNAP